MGLEALWTDSREDLGVPILPSRDGLFPREAALRQEFENLVSLVGPLLGEWIVYGVEGREGLRRGGR